MWNKIDLLPEADAPAILSGRHELSLAVSARTGAGVPEMLAKIETILAEGLVDVQVTIPYGRYDLVQLVYEQGSVTTKEDGPAGVRLTARVPAGLARLLGGFGAED